VSGIEPSDALRSTLLAIPSRIPLERLDRAWIFPPKEISGRESGLLVLALLPTADFPEDHRQILTLRYEKERARPRSAPTLTLIEQGWAPGDRIPRVIGGVVARLEEAQEPEEHSLAGDADRWSALLRHFGASIVDPGNGE
jgi:hypothetical protein